MNERRGYWNRRGFLASLAAIGATSLADSANGLGMAAPRKLKLGFDNFSIRAFDWKAPQLIEYAASQKVDTLLISDLEAYESLDEDYLKRIRAQADRAGIENIGDRWLEFAPSPVRSIRSQSPGFPRRILGKCWKKGRLRGVTGKIVPVGGPRDEGRIIAIRHRSLPSGEDI